MGLGSPAGGAWLASLGAGGVGANLPGIALSGHGYALIPGDRPQFSFQLLGAVMSLK